AAGSSGRRSAMPGEHTAPRAATQEAAAQEVPAREESAQEAAAPGAGEATRGPIPPVYPSPRAPPPPAHPSSTPHPPHPSARLPRPGSVLLVSGHGESAPLPIGATATMPLVYDFWGFEDRYYQVRYPAPGAPGLAADVRKLLRTAGTPVQDIGDRGLDHGAYVPLVEMYPRADVPVLQISLPTLDPQQLFEVGRKLAPLRDDGVLIVGSGFFTHNLRAMSLDGSVSSVMSDFDHWGAEALAHGDIDALIDFQHQAPAARQAHPRTEHFAPLFGTLGAASGDLTGAQTVIDSVWFGLAKRSIQVA